jgi:hypothetical protein
MISVLGNETSLKQVFSDNKKYWIKVFRGYTPMEPPGFRYFYLLI